MFVCKSDNYFWGEKDCVFTDFLEVVDVVIDEANVYLRNRFFFSALLCLREGVKLYFLFADLNAALERVVSQVFLRGVVEEAIWLFDVFACFYVVGNDETFCLAYHLFL